MDIAMGQWGEATDVKLPQPSAKNALKIQWFYYHKRPLAR